MNLRHGTVSCIGASTSVCTTAKSGHIKPSGRRRPSPDGYPAVMAIRIIGAGLAFLSQVFFARVMGTCEFYSYAFVLLTVLSVLAPPRRARSLGCVT
ncbi:MAG: hypothetical protein ACXW3P_07215 [Rhodospirillales bacterium]